MCFVQSEREALQWAAYEKQQKELEKQQDIVRRLTGGAQSGRAAGEGMIMLLSIGKSVCACCCLRHDW